MSDSRYESEELYRVNLKRLAGQIRCQLPTDEWEAMRVLEICRWLVMWEHSDAYAGMMRDAVKPGEGASYNGKVRCLR